MISCVCLVGNQIYHEINSNESNSFYVISTLLDILKQIEEIFLKLFINIDNKKTLPETPNIVSIIKIFHLSSGIKELLLYLLTFNIRPYDYAVDDRKNIHIYELEKK